jgi:precorrin-2 dehydrogenase/sirohydrochlorin ferrochelatase
MFPIALDLKKIPILLIGEGEALKRRHKQLLEYGAISLWERAGGEGIELNSNARIFDKSPHPHPLPEGEGIWAGAKIIMVAGLPYEISAQIAASARKAGKLVNVEDMNDLCDFYFTANVRRGDLVISVSTSGASPTLSQKIRDYIGKKFGKEWVERTKEMAEFRNQLKAQGKTIPQVLKASNEFLAEKGWFND